MEREPHVGFIGVGNMGGPMTLNLAKAGYQVRLFDVREDVLRRAATQHANFAIAESLADLAKTCEVVITMLPDSNVVYNVVLGAKDRDSGARAGGLTDDLQPGSIIIDMSSSYAPATRRLAEELEPRGITLIDAPVSGGVPRAVTGELAIMVGGRDAQIDRVEPTLAAMGKVFRVGEVGAGHAMKALNNYLSAVGLIATSEALAVGMAFGLDGKRMVDVLNASTGRNNTTENKAERYLLPEKFNAGFTLSLLEKDVGMARDLALGLGVEARTLELVTTTLRQALSALGKEVDHTEVYRFIKSSQRNGKA